MAKAIPVEKNRNYTVDITGLTSEGLGVARMKIYSICGRRTGRGTGRDKNSKGAGYAFGKLLRILKAADCRIEPSCGVVKDAGLPAAAYEL